MLDFDDKKTVTILQVFANLKGKAIRYNQLDRESAEILGKKMDSRSFANIVRCLTEERILVREEINRYCIEYKLTKEGYRLLSEKYKVYSQHRELPSIMKVLDDFYG